MREEDVFRKTAAAVFLSVCCVWIGLLIAPLTDHGLSGILRGLGSVLSHPFRITLCRGSLKTAAAALIAGWTCAAVIRSGNRDVRPGAEHGSARWGRPRAVNRRYRGKKGEGEKILTDGVSIGMDSRRHGRNLNVLVVGGSGSGKTRYYCLPNILSAEQNSVIVLDPKRAVF